LFKHTNDLFMDYVYRTILSDDEYFSK
jgi:hypothetical protein